MKSRLELFLIGLMLGIIVPVIGPILFNIVYFNTLNKKGIEYHFTDKYAAIWGGIFGAAFVAVVLLSSSNIWWPWVERVLN